MAAPIVTRSRWPKLIVSGSSAEQPRPARPNTSTPAAPSPLGQQRRQAERDGGHERQQPVRARRRGTGARSPRTATRPTVTIAQNAVRASEASGRRGARGRRSCKRRPVAARRLDDPVEEREAGEQPERRRHGAGRPCARSARPASPTRAAGPRLTTSSTPISDGHEQRQAPPRAQAEEDRDQDRRERRPEAQQGVEVQHRPIGGRREEPAARCSATGRSARSRSRATSSRPGASGRAAAPRRSRAGSGAAASSRPGRRRAPRGRRA